MSILDISDMYDKRTRVHVSGNIWSFQTNKTLQHKRSDIDLSKGTKIFKNKPLLFQNMSTLSALKKLLLAIESYSPRCGN